MEQFHSFDDEPAIIVNDHKEKDMDTGEEIDVEWYKAWYDNGELLKVERNWFITYQKE